MNNLAIPASWPLRRSIPAIGVMLAFSVTPPLPAAPSSPLDPFSFTTGYVGFNDGIYSLHNSGLASRTSNSFSLDGAGLWSIDPRSSLQMDGEYFRLSPGGGFASTNAWSFDTHYTYKFDDLPVGAFLGEFSNGPTTWGGGLETSLPLKPDPLPECYSMGGDPTLNLQGYYGRTHSTKLNHCGGRMELRLYPRDILRVSLDLDYQHTSQNSIPGFHFSDNIWSFGAGCGYQFPCGWIAYGEYEHTHFGTSGLGVDGFTLGAHYCFGKKAKIRENETPVLSFSHLLGVSTKF
jgi:hypothetical protein